MTLVLRIENFDQLENGGPTSLTLDQRGASIGRRAAMDWSLPDPSKMISGHHFDITYDNGVYRLTDVSMNGTFVDGQRHRLEGPLELRGGERLIVGHYIIGVELVSAQANAAPPAQDDPWGAFADPSGMGPVSGGAGGAGLDALNDGFIQMQRPGGSGGMKTETSLQLPMHSQGMSAPPQAPASAPTASAIQTPTGWGLPLPDAMTPQEPQPPEEPFVAYVPTLGQDTPAEPAPLPEASRPAPQPRPPVEEAPVDVPYTPSLGQDAPQEPEPQLSVPPAPEASRPPYAPSLGQDSAAVPTPPPAYDMPQSPQPPSLPHSEAPPSSIPMPRPVPPGPAPSAVPTPQAAPPQPQPMPAQAAPAPMGGGDVSAALRAFCEGAGLDPKAVKPEDAAALMHMLGRCVRVATEEQMAMLKARADVKNFTRGGVRTMLSANANNPMKFMPDSQQALELMFVSPRDGFMTGADSFKDALSDIRQHQEAVFRALQPALAEVFRGLSPEEIESACEGTGSNLLGGKRTGKQWTTYVERWDQKAQAGEHGILDAFLQAFAKAYADANN